MSLVFPPIFEADTKLIYGYSFVAPLRESLMIKIYKFRLRFTSSDKRIVR